MRLADFDFDLPPDRIAQRPARPRDSARLLVMRRDGGLEDRVVGELPALLRAGDLLVANDTRVIRARLAGRRGAATVEVTLHREEDARTWRAFARPARKLAPGDRVEFAPGFAAAVAAKGGGGEVTLEFDRGGAELAAALAAHGSMPLPPYIRRGAADAADETDYQTAFAARPGAVAAPTAGLHFTPRLLAALDAAGVARATVTLHVGAGTFLPVKDDDVSRHVMHAERGEVPEAAAAAVAAARARGGRVVAVGTTALRLLETVAAERGAIAAWAGETRLFVTPGFRFRAVDLLLTNFHLPRSTLFMLAAAFAGLARVKAAYAHAVGAGYRFFSYGDACLIEPAAERAA
jgi:S-adenosylmethionine:tRNA ribosyltransferase-isomerase